eukprot:1408181-Pleurochrysis_carterae.AAC.2
MAVQANLILYGDLPRAFTIRAGGKGMISTDTNSHWQGSGRRRGGWTHLRGGSRKGSSAGSSNHREQRYPRAWGAEREAL